MKYLKNFRKAASDVRTALKAAIVGFIIDKLAWALADDAVMTVRTLGEMYCDVPDDVKDVTTEVYTFLLLYGPKKKAGRDWLNQPE